MGKSKPKVRVTQYGMAIHFGICQGVVRRLNRIFIDEKVAWEGAITNQRSFQIKNPNLFGGLQKEGGVEGRCYWQTGNFTQKASTRLAHFLGGRTPDTAPGFRGIATALLADGLGEGFYWRANQPVIPPIWFNLTRIFRDWYPERAQVGSQDSRRIAFLITADDSGSMATGTRLQTLKTAVLEAGEELAEAAQSGFQVDFGLVRWGSRGESTVYSVRNGTPDQIRSVASSINFWDGTNDTLFGSGAGTDFDEAASRAVQFFSPTLGENYSERKWVFITDGQPTGNSDDLAVTVASDLIDQTSGQYSEQSGTAVDIYGANIEETDTSATNKIDNQSGTRVIQDGQPDALFDVIQSAIYDGSTGPDMNPAHIIYECLTNRVWGMGAPASSIDEDSFRSAADLLLLEQFGLSMIWTQQAQIESFVQEVLDHIQAALFVDPASGKFVLRLVRNDFDAASLEVYDESVCRVKTFQRRSPGEIINEITVTWTNPANEQEETITAQDLGAIAINAGEVKADQRNYYGVRRRALARKLLARDLSSATAPLSTATILVDRRAWQRKPVDRIKLTSAKHGVQELIMRVVRVNYGRAGQSEIEIELIQDIFSFEEPEIPEPPDTLLEDIREEPEAPTFVLPMTMNYYFAANFLESVDLSNVAYPDAFVSVIVGSEQEDASDFVAASEVIDAVGNANLASLGEFSFTAFSTLPTSLDAEVQSVLPILPLVGQGAGPEVGGFGIIGLDLGEERAEIVTVTALTDTEITILRGMLDSAPRTWSMGTKVFWLNEAMIVEDETVRAASNVVDYYILPQTSLGQFPLAAATPNPYAINDRAWAPTRPANVTINGIAFADVDARELSTIPVSWANRNRVMEDSQVLRWDDPNITPEAGQETVIEIVDQVSGAVTRQIVVAEGETSRVLIPEDFDGANLALVRLKARRDGIDSFGYNEQRVTIASGFGRNFGLNFGR